MAGVFIAARPCRACGVMVFDLRHVTTNRHAPIEAAPVADGNIAVDIEAGTYRLVGRDFRQGHEAIGQRFVSHFKNCPEAAKFRAGRPTHGR